MVSTLALLALQQESTAPARLILAVLCVVVMSSVAVGVSIGLARRMQQIADRTPRKTPPPPTHNDEPER